MFCICMIFSAISIQAEQNQTSIDLLISQPAADRVTVTIYQQAFHPDILIIEPNTDVIWTNLEPQPHSVVSDDGYFRSDLLGQGESFNYTFTKQGLFMYHDGAHPTTTGKVYVKIGGNQPPFKPVVQGPTDGIKKTTYNYTAVTADPEGSKVSYFFDWGDNSNSGWTPFVNSSTPVNASHSWARKGSFVVKVQAKDFYANATSDWGTLTVTVPISVDIPGFHILEKLFERFPRLFPTLRYIMGY